MRKEKVNCRGEETHCQNSRGCKSEKKKKNSSSKSSPALEYNQLCYRILWCSAPCKEFQVLYLVCCKEWQLSLILSPPQSTPSSLTVFTLCVTLGQSAAMSELTSSMCVIMVMVTIMSYFQWSSDRAAFESLTSRSSAQWVQMFSLSHFSGHWYDFGVWRLVLMLDFPLGDNLI